MNLWYSANFDLLTFWFCSLGQEEDLQQQLLGSNKPTMIKNLFLATAFIYLAVSIEAAVRFSRSDVGSNGFTEDVLVFKDRLFVPYGPDRHSIPVQDPSDQPWTGYGYGLGATEHWAYDHVNKYIYSQSESGGYITVIDYSSLPGEVTKFSMDVGGDNVDVRDVVVCSEESLVFVTVTDQNKVLMYDAVKRANPKTPTLLAEIEAGNSPDAMKLSNDCEILAVANQNEGASVLSEGAITIVKNFRSQDGPQVIPVLLNVFTEAYLLDRKVNMPLTRNAMTYWSRELGLGWEGTGGLIDQYNPAIAFDPEFMAFNYDGSLLFLNLQDNSALVRIDTATGQALAVDGYGLKKAPADIVDDGECNLVNPDCLYLSRTPDGIASLEYEGTTYVFTADEGSAFDLDAYEEAYESEDVFLTNGAIAFSGFVLSAEVQQCRQHFAQDCEEDWCSNFEMSVGSLAVNYDDTNAPVLEHVVGFGGRGISLYRIPESVDDEAAFVWDSSSDFETRTCALYPWAHNAVMDEEFAPVGGPRWILSGSDDRGNIEARNDPNRDGCTLDDGSVGACPLKRTVDEKAQEDGLAVESVVVGVACDHLVVLGCGENNGMCLLYDFTDINNPTLLKTFNLSPVSESMNPQQTYLKTLGDLDAETTLFLSPEHSPTGQSGFLFGGAISGTLSFWEFQCQTPEQGSNSLTTSDGNDGLSGGAIAGIIIGAVVGVVIIGFLARKMSGGGRGKSDAKTSTTHGDDSEGMT